MHSIFPLDSFTKPGLKATRLEAQNNFFRLEVVTVESRVLPFRLEK